MKKKKLTSIEFELEILTLYLRSSNPTHNRLATNTHVATKNTNYNQFQLGEPCCKLSFLIRLNLYMFYNQIL